jgi:hypothetical protein
MAATHTFEIKAGSLNYTGNIDTSDQGILSYSEDQPEELPEQVDTDFKRILTIIENFIQKYGSLEKFEVKEVE